MQFLSKYLRAWKLAWLICSKFNSCSCHSQAEWTIRAKVFKLDDIEVHLSVYVQFMRKPEFSVASDFPIYLFNWIVSWNDSRIIPWLYVVYVCVTIRIWTQQVVNSGSRKQSALKNGQFTWGWQEDAAIIINWNVGILIIWWILIARKHKKRRNSLWLWFETWFSMSLIFYDEIHLVFSVFFLSHKILIES